MNMISTGAFQNEMDASYKDAIEKLRVFGKKYKVARRRRFGGCHGCLWPMMQLLLQQRRHRFNTPTTTPVVTALVAGSDTTGTSGSDSFSGVTVH